AKLADVERGVPVEWDIVQREVLVVGTLNRVQDERAVFDAAAHRTDLVQAPGEGHEAVAADAAIGWAQSCHAANSGWLHDRAARLGADGEADKARSSCGARTGG